MGESTNDGVQVMPKTPHTPSFFTMNNIIQKKMTKNIHFFLRLLFINTFVHNP